MWRVVVLVAVALAGCDDSQSTLHRARDAGAAPHPSAAVEDSYAEECARGGLSGAQRSQCARFLAFLATPPRCPERPRITAPSYGHCPSEAKVMPKHMGRLRFDTAADPLAKAVVSKLRTSQSVRLCYAAGLVDQPQLRGRVHLSLVVDRLGRFQSVSSAGSSLADPLALECFVRQAAELRVDDRPAGPRKVTIGFSLAP